MNNHFKLSVLLGLLLLSLGQAKIHAQSVAGVELEIGPTSSNQATGTNKYNGAIGEQNNVTGVNSFSVGYGNSVGGWGSMALGEGNSVSSKWGTLVMGSDNTSASFSPMFVFGSDNSIFGDHNFAVGKGHHMGISEDYMAYLCVTFGAYNNIGDTAIACFASGTNNYISGYFEYPGYVLAENVSVFGRGLIGQFSNSTIVGQYNGYGGVGLLFAIGNGGDASHRSSALEVYNDGSIKMARQGDILMGEFGNSEP